MADKDLYWRVMSTRPSPLRDCYRRLLWADGDGEALSDAIDAFTGARGGPRPHVIFVQFDGQVWNATFLRLIEEREEWEAFEGFSRLLGSLLDNLCACLNYLACQMAELAIREDPTLACPQLPWSQQLHPSAVEFPIFNAPAKYQSGNKVRKLPQRMRDALKAVQPCYGGDCYLWVLQELAAEFRHRVVHTAAIVPLPDRFEVLLSGQPVAADIEALVADGHPLQHNTEVMRWRMPGIPANRHEDVQPNIAVTVGIEHPLCANENLVSTVNGVNAAVRQVLEDFEAKFFS